MQRSETLLPAAWDDLGKWAVARSASLRPTEECSTHCLHLPLAAARPSCCQRGCLDSAERVLARTGVELGAGAPSWRLIPRQAPARRLGSPLPLSGSVSLPPPCSASLSLCLYMSLSLPLYVSLSVSICVSLSLSRLVSLSLLPSPPLHPPSTHLLCRSWATLSHRPDACICWHSSPTRRRSTGRLSGWWSRPSAWEAARSSGTSPP